MSRHNKRHRRVRKFREGPNFPGQHLMHNKRLAKDLVAMAQLKPHALVVEIGAGTGILTLSLAENAGKVLAVENDPDFVEKLRRITACQPNITVLEKDFLRIPLPRRPFYVVANIPYAITTPILGKLLDQPTLPFQGGVLVVEKGAAVRFISTPITNPRILVWRLWFDMKLVRTLSPYHFSPPPSVDSAVLILERKKEPAVPMCRHNRFRALAVHGLKYPRLPICEALKDVFTVPQINRLARDMKLDRDTPIGALNERQWGKVFNTMIQRVKSFRWPKLSRRH